MSKLVRDKVENHLKGRAAIQFKNADESERAALLFSKLLEEAAEWLSATDRDQRLKELGDLQEVIWALAKMDDWTDMEILAQASGKRRVRGEFDDLTIMEVELEKPSVYMTRGEENVPAPWPGAGDGPWYSG